MLKPVKVAIQGEVGSNSAAAAALLVGPATPLLCCETFAAAFGALGSGRAAQAVVPWENSTAGLVPEVFSRLSEAEAEPLWVCAEAHLPISFVAAALHPDASRIRRILAHPMAKAQCGRFLLASGWEVVFCHDTAGAARQVREEADPELAALCPPGVVEGYGLHLLAKGCGDLAQARTRFFLVSSAPRSPAAADDRSLVVLEAGTDPGAAHACFAPAVPLQAVHARGGGGGRVLELGAGAGDLAVQLGLQRLGAAGRLLGSFCARAVHPEIAAR